MKKEMEEREVCISEENRSQRRKCIEAVYLGVEGYGTVTGEQKELFWHRFSVCGQTKLFQISSAGNYAIQNCMEEGCLYQIVEEDDVVTGAAPAGGIAGCVNAVEAEHMCVGTRKIPVGRGASTARILTAPGGSSVCPAAVQTGDRVRLLTDREGTARQIYITFLPDCYLQPVQGIPGKKTLKNFLATAMMPVGTVLYVFGGGWNWQDTGPGCQAETLGLSQSWIRFFQSQDAGYTYKNPNPARSYYPFHGWNQYHYAGLDCSGYVGWAVYHTFHRESGLSGCVMAAKKMARAFALNGWGDWTQTERDFRPGDVISMSGHVWICLGTCGDGSIVILHSTPSESREGKPGGGVQLSALNPKGDRDCEAYRLASHVMEKYYPLWSTRYEAVVRDYETYTQPDLSGDAGEWVGRFRWNLDGGGLNDPDSYVRMSASEILTNLLGTDRALYQRG